MALQSAGFSFVSGPYIELPASFSGRVVRGSDGATLSVVSPATGLPTTLHCTDGSTISNTAAAVSALTGSVTLRVPVWVVMQGPASAAGKTFTWPSQDQTVVDSTGLIFVPADAVNGMPQGFVRANP
jgi:hypothetical protein